MAKNEMEKEVYKLQNKISNAYSKCDPNSEHHDTMLYQNDGAYGMLHEIIQDIHNNDLEGIESGIQTLKDTLKYCKTVLKIQKLEATLKPIFG